MHYWSIKPVWGVPERLTGDRCYDPQKKYHFDREMADYSAHPQDPNHMYLRCNLGLANPISENWSLIGKR